MVIQESYGEQQGSWGNNDNMPCCTEYLPERRSRKVKEED